MPCCLYIISDSGGKLAVKEFFDPRETPYSPNQPPRKQDGQKHQTCGGAALAGCPPAGSGKHFFAKEERNRVEVA